MDYVTLNNGVRMPKLGYGVYQVTPEECERCVSDALSVGYRSIDTAQAYFNEEGVGRAVKKSGIARGELFLTTKVWISNAGERRAEASIDASLKKLGTDEEERFPKPDLIIIDGGKGQLSAVGEIFNQMGISGIELISLAKREEEVFTLTSEESIRIDHRDFALKMLQRIRDEAHRFAITYFRNLHSKRNLESVLSEIEGVGKKKRMTLMERFGTIDKIMNAGEEELASTEGIGPVLAKNIRKYFEEKL